MYADAGQVESDSFHTREAFKAFAGVTPGLEMLGVDTSQGKAE